MHHMVRFWSVTVMNNVWMNSMMDGFMMDRDDLMMHRSHYSSMVTKGNMVNDIMDKRSRCRNNIVNDVRGGGMWLILYNSCMGSSVQSSFR